MRADSAGARTWLLGALAAWALCAWLLGLLGMGGEVRALPEDPSLLQPLPQARKAPPSRLGPLAQYSEIARRPLFSEDRRPQPFFINRDGEDAKPGFDYVLTSVVVAPGFRLAILQPSGGGESIRVREGAAPEAAPGWTLSTLDARSAVFNGPEGERRLELRVFDGEGGEPPTPLSAPGGRADVPAQTQPAPPMAGPSPRQRTSGTAAAPQTAPAADDAAEAADAAQPAAEADNRPSAEQIDAIRKRIEARRARLREQQQSSSGQTP